MLYVQKIPFLKFKYFEMSFLNYYKVNLSYISFIDFQFYSRLKGDHSPEFVILFHLCGLTLFEFHFYDSRHFLLDIKTVNNLEEENDNIKENISS